MRFIRLMILILKMIIESGIYMNKSNKWAAYIVFLVFLIIAGYGIYQWIRFRHIDGAAILCSFIVFSYLINWINWGDHEGSSKKGDEGRQIEMKSAKVSYFVLMVLAAIILFVSEGVTQISEIDNYPLLIVVGLTFVIQPITEFFYKKIK